LISSGISSEIGNFAWRGIYLPQGIVYMHKRPDIFAVSAHTEIIFKLLADLLAGGGVMEHLVGLVFWMVNIENI